LILVIQDVHGIVRGPKSGTFCIKIDYIDTQEITPSCTDSKQPTYFGKCIDKKDNKC
jgi:hypothetical protein